VKLVLCALFFTHRWTCKIISIVLIMVAGSIVYEPVKARTVMSTCRWNRVSYEKRNLIAYIGKEYDR
jgi:hypothetical protein